MPIETKTRTRRSPRGMRWGDNTPFAWQDGNLQFPSSAAKPQSPLQSLNAGSSGYRVSALSERPAPSWRCSALRSVTSRHSWGLSTARWRQPSLTPPQINTLETENWREVQEGMQNFPIKTFSGCLNPSSKPFTGKSSSASSLRNFLERSSLHSAAKNRVAPALWGHAFSRKYSSV